MNQEMQRPYPGDPNIQNARQPRRQEEVSDKVLTLPNIISFLRLCLVPVYIFLLFQGDDALATLIFCIAAITDFLDGQVARRTHQVSRLGKLLDPAVDTILMMSAIICVFLLGRLPAWIMLFIVIREVFLLLGGSILLFKFDIRVPVVYAGKVATTLLFIGIAATLLNYPLMPGLNLIDASWLPGFSRYLTIWSIWLIYAGIVLQFLVTVYYCIVAARMLAEHRRNQMQVVYRMYRG